MRLRATLYVRLSEAAGETNLSKEGMLADLRVLAEHLNCDVAGEHIDDGLSGEIRDRPEFLAWLADARENRADVMLAWSGDRLTREGINAAAMVLDVVEGKDTKTGKVVRTPVRFVSFDDKLDSQEGDAFRWRFVIAAEVARGERKRMVARSQARARRMREQGRHYGRIPFGYMRNPDRGAEGAHDLAVDGAESAALKEAARRALEGTSPNQIARWLNATGQLPRSGRQWTRQTIVEALTNFGNAGVPQYPGAAPRPAILEYSTVEKLSRKFASAPTGKRGGARSATRSSKARLVPILVCHDCNNPMYSSSGRYVCMTAGNGGICGGAVSIVKELAERDVIGAYHEMFGDLPEVRREVIDPNAALRDEVELQHAAVMQRLATAPTAEDFATLQALTARRAELKTAETVVETRWVTTGRTLAEAFDAETQEGQRDLLARVFERIVCRPRGTKPRLVVEVRQEVVDAVAKAAREVAEARL